MTSKLAVRLAAATVSGLGLIGGLGAAAGAQSATIDTTGPGSTNKITAHQSTKIKTMNTNNVGVTSNNSQTATSGNAKVWGNTTGGDATSGDATNDHSFSADLTVDNSGSCGCLSSISSDPMGDASVTNTGPNSHNTISASSNTDVSMTNTNTVNVTSNNTQTAKTGSATVAGNTTGGSATTGDASNTSTEMVTVSVQN